MVSDGMTKRTTTIMVGICLLFVGTLSLGCKGSKGPTEAPKPAPAAAIEKAPTAGVPADQSDEALVVEVPVAPEKKQPDPTTFDAATVAVVGPSSEKIPAGVAVVEPSEGAAAEKAAAEKAAAEKAAAEKTAAEKTAALNVELQPKLLAELKPHMAKCKHAADMVKAAIRQMRKAVSRGDMGALQGGNDRLGSLGMKVAVAEEGGTQVIDGYRARGVDIEKIQEQFNAACNTDIEDAE